MRTRRRSCAPFGTDEGLSGIGQAESPSLVIDAITHCQGGLQDLLRGEDPTQVERLWQKMYDRTSCTMGIKLFTRSDHSASNNH